MKTECPVAKTHELERVILFADLEPGELERLARISVALKLERGEELFFEGDASKGFFAVVEGLIRVYKVAPDGREQVLHLVGPGQTFAEASMFGESRYPASAGAVQPSKLLLIPKGPFLKLLRSEPEIALKLLASMAEWLKRLSGLVETLSLKNVEARLAEYLLARALEEGRPAAEGVLLTLDMEKRMVAARIGTISETFSRTLKKLKDKGLVREEGPNIFITDLEGLRALAEG